MGRPAGWMKELTGRSAMKSPGKPSHRREVERWFWREIAKGLSSEDAARAVGVSSAAGVRWFGERGGMATFLLDSVSCRYLCFEEREEIALLRAEGKGVREIAREIGRSPSTISRELRRNAATRGGKLEYRASVAQWKAELVARRPKTAKLAADERLREYVQDRLAGKVRWPVGRSRGGRAATSRVVRTDGGRPGGARSRSQLGCTSTSPMIHRCGSPTRRSTSRCSCRAAARWPAS